MGELGPRGELGLQRWTQIQGGTFTPLFTPGVNTQMFRRTEGRQRVFKPGGQLHPWGSHFATRGQDYYRPHNSTYNPKQTEIASWRRTTKTCSARKLTSEYERRVISSEKLRMKNNIGSGLKYLGMLSTWGWMSHECWVFWQLLSEKSMHYFSSSFTFTTFHFYTFKQTNVIKAKLASPIIYTFYGSEPASSKWIDFFLLKLFSHQHRLKVPKPDPRGEFSNQYSYLGKKSCLAKAGAKAIIESA
jgi:hypothetical protein